MNTDTTNASKCPLCGEDNNCAMAADPESSEPCWCSNVQFSEELLARVPEHLRNQACICAACAGA